MKRLVFIAATLSISIGAAWADSYSVKSGQTVLIGTRAYWNDSCVANGFARYEVTKKPKLGSVVFKKESRKVERVDEGTTNCVGKSVLGISTYYKANKGAKGTDSFSLAVTTPTGKHMSFTNTMTVK